MNSIRSEILRKIMHQPGMRFNELWDKSDPSNKFAYHLRSMEEDGLIEKQGELYFLTGEGKQYVSAIDGKTGSEAKAPLVCVAILVFDGDKVLMQQRKKEPFYDFWGFPSGKIQFSQYILEAARDELMEETGLEAELSIKGLFCSKTFNDDKQIFNHHIFIIRGEHAKGKLLAQTREGLNEWVPVKDIEKRHIFPDIPYLVKAANSERFALVEIDRKQSAGSYLGNDAIKETIL
jgi:8-oxo-dGTP diphosphatase